MVFYKGENTAVEDLAKKHINTFGDGLDPASAVVNTSSIYVDLTDIKPDLLQQIRYSTQEITEKYPKQGSYKVIAEKIFKSEELQHVGNDEQFQVKLKNWLENVQKTGDQQLTVTADDFKVVKYNLPDKPDSKVLLLQKALSEVDIDQFWKEVLKYMENMKLISALETRTITYVDVIDGKPLILICLLLSASREVIERLLKEGYFIIGERIFKAEKRTPFNVPWEEMLKAWLKNAKKKTGVQQPARKVADFKVVSYSLPGQTDYINLMLFYKGLQKEETEKFWKEFPQKA